MCGRTHLPSRILSLYSSGKCSFCAGLFIIPFLVWTLTVRTLASFPGKVSTTFPSFHFPLSRLSSDMSATSLCFNRISSLVHSANIHVTKETKNCLWSRCCYLKHSERETSAFFVGVSGGFPKSLPTAYKAGVMIRLSCMSLPR